MPLAGNHLRLKRRKKGKLCSWERTVFFTHHQFLTKAYCISKYCLAESEKLVDGEIFKWGDFMFPIKPKHSSISFTYKCTLGTSGAKSHQNDLKPRKFLFLLWFFCTFFFSTLLFPLIFGKLNLDFGKPYVYPWVMWV